MCRIFSIIVGIATLFAVAATFVTANAAEAQTVRDDFSKTVRVRAEYFLYDDSQSVAQQKIARTLDKAVASGADTVDTEVVWATVDRGDWGGATRTYDWRYLDYFVAQAESRGLKVNMMLTTTPDWVHPDLKGSVSSAEARRWTAPKGEAQLAHYSNFVTDVANRYEGRIGHYEIWNEQNHTVFWRSGPNPGQYAALLRTAYFAIRKEDPGAEVMFGGLALNNVGYVEAYYRAVKAQYPGASENNYFFDVMGVHPYVHPNRSNLSPDRYTQEVVGPLDTADYDFIGTVDGNYLGFRKIKAAMDASGDTGKNLFFSEFGYEVKPGVITDARRAFYLKRAYELAMQTPYVEGMSWYAFRETRYADPSSWTLLNASLEATKTYQALTETFSQPPSSARGVSSVPSGTPEVEMVFSPDGSGGYVIKSEVSGLENSEVASWELYRDGEMVREGAGGQGFSTRSSASEVEGHDFMLAAYTKSGSVWHSGPQDPTVEEAEANSAPTITKVTPESGIKTKDRTPSMGATVRDADQQLRKSDIRVYRDGNAVSDFSYDASTDRLKLTTNRLSYGWHRIKIVARDGAGKVVTKVVSIRVVAG